MQVTRGGYMERVDVGPAAADPLRYAIEGRFVFNRAESLAIHTYLAARSVWFDRLVYPATRWALHRLGRHSALLCRGDTRCHPLRARRQ